jgi:hypothetical protein
VVGDQAVIVTPLSEIQGAPIEIVTPDGTAVAA